MKPLVFVLSAGRSGTRFVADLFQKLCSDKVEAWHERLKTNASTRKYFRRYAPEDLDLQRSDPYIKDMLISIKDTIKEKSYLDTGWNLHSLFPLFIEEFGSNVRFVLQIRHPFDAAASHAIKGAYRIDWDTLLDWDKNCFLKPEDNVFHKEVDWDSMTSFEKSLWRWGELLLYWEELKSRYPNIQWHVIKAEDLFKDIKNIYLYFKLLDVELLPVVTLERYLKTARKNQLKTDWKLWYGLRQNEWKKYYNYPWILELAKSYGYNSDKDIIKDKFQKYKRPIALQKRIIYKIQKILSK